ncbi:MAG: GntR family transcriptional regulator [Lentisphaerae bacterium]|nr:GntR family transcriptional regulator [Lentisphaerota bacterium]
MKNTMVKSKYGNLAEILKKEIITGRIKPGDALPSQQQLIDRYEVSLSTVRKCLSCLAEEGYVAARHGKGVFVLDPKNHARQLSQKAIGFVIVNDQSRLGFTDMTVLNGATEAMQEAGRRISYSFISPTPSGVEDLELLLEDVDGVILRTPPDQHIIFDVLRRSRVPVVILDHPDILGVVPGVFSCVSYDIYAAGYTAGQALAFNGHRNIVMLHFASERLVAPLVQGLKQVCEDCEIECPEIIESHGVEQNVKVTNELAKRDDISGIVVSGWGHCNTLVGRMRDQGIKIPEDKSIIAIGTHNIGDVYGDMDETGIICSVQRLGYEGARILIESPSKSVEKTLIGQFRKGSTLARLSH